MHTDRFLKMLVSIIIFLKMRIIGKWWDYGENGRKTCAGACEGPGSGNPRVGLNLTLHFQSIQRFKLRIVNIITRKREG